MYQLYVGPSQRISILENFYAISDCLLHMIYLYMECLKVILKATLRLKVNRNFSHGKIAQKYKAMRHHNKTASGYTYLFGWSL